MKSVKRICSGRNGFSWSLMGNLLVFLWVSILFIQNTEAGEVRTQKDIYAPNESITVNFSGLPGSPQDWITVVTSGAPENTYNEWFYTGGQKQGTHAFKGMAPGNYEVRLYYDWPSGGYQVRGRYAFRVTESAAPPPPNPPNQDIRGGLISTQKSYYSPNETVVVEFRNFPGNPQDWITIVRSDASDDTYNEWFYTGGKQQGTHAFKGLVPGIYEVRAYFNWPNGGYNVKERYRFEVR